jgi:hypothetical protein
MIIFWLFFLAIIDAYEVAAVLFVFYLIFKLFDDGFLFTFFWFVIFHCVFEAPINNENNVILDETYTTIESNNETINTTTVTNIKIESGNGNLNFTSSTKETKKEISKQEDDKNIK